MSDRPPRVSVGMPVYNGERYIREALDSILGQTFTDFELIISDNSSTDRTGAICREYAERDTRISYLRQDHNLGLVANYNRVFEAAQGEYFKWASSNDVCEPTMLARCVEMLDADPEMVLCYPRTTLFDEISGTEAEYHDGLTLTSESPCERVKALISALRLNNAMNGLIRISALRRTDLIADFVASDVNLLLQLSLLGKFGEVAEPLFRRRVHPNEDTRNGDTERLLKIYNPALDRHRAFTFWRLNLEHLRSVWRAPIGFGDKLSLTGFLMRKLFWDRRMLAFELTHRGKVRQGRA